MIDEGLDVDTKTKYGATALAYAVDKGHIEIVRFLIDKGADVNSTDTFYNATPLAWAGMNERYEIAGVLLENGATGADDTLSQGAREGNKALVEAARSRASTSRGRAWPRRWRWPRHSKTARRSSPC